MKKFITNKYILYLIGIIFFTFVWWLLSIVIGEQTLVFPGPIITLKEVFKVLHTKYIYKCLSITFIRMLIGYGISLILAIILGTIAGNNKYIKEILKPSIVVLKAIPTAAILFLFLVLLGAKHAPIIIVSLISFPILYESVVGGYENIEKNIIDAMKIDGENNIKNILKVKLPLSIPYILVGIASSFGLAFKIEIMAEVLTGDTNSGVGAAILAAQRNDPSNMVPIFAYSFIAVTLVLLIDLLMNLIKNKLR